MTFGDRIKTVMANYDSRNRTERVLIAVAVLGMTIWLSYELVQAPLQEQRSALQRQLDAAGNRLVAMQTREQIAQQNALEDPDRAANERLSRLMTDQAQVQDQIEALAGNLVTPNTMTQMLTSVLDDQPGLSLARVENKVPLPMRSVTQVSGEGGGAPMAQIYKHGLVLELQGDFFSMLRYLRYLESMSERFFWDSIHYRQTNWPEARITLELHTLSTQQGFVGV